MGGRWLFQIRHTVTWTPNDHQIAIIIDQLQAGDPVVFNHGTLKGTMQDIKHFGHLLHVTVKAAHKLQFSETLRSKLD